MKNSKWSFVLFSLVLFLVPLQTSAQVFGPVSYVALGDSLAAGQTPTREIDTGYSDLIALEIARNQPLAFYSKDLAFPGFTTADVLKRVQSKEAKPLLQNANVITISAGANDLLRLIKSDAKSGSLSFQQIPADYSLNSVRKNMKTILTELKKTAPKAEIYIMGYYFAYPHARDSQKVGTAKQLTKLNEILAKEAKEAGVNFVSVDAAFGDDAIGKVPNPADVHPNAEGYRAMANSFFNVYAKGGMQVTSGEIPPANPLTFEEIMQDRQGALEEGDQSATLPSSYIDEEFIAVTEIKPII
ncbi:GDSL-type esterase/lipase family protein [Paenisporosarcina quisquiliarum]|uniref:GDSL-type esterase/lipase family protein n=1 Tax=Paenisporosarcina quisquiliarum TaxID=365346 RepID=A0A9X3RCZ5_9BACL|nr:SGNH/GDSL hydrolase family protein [Paenisporosarcina quisquiliarum]MCZ8537016.1 GDSL-type esterase/lipase family protein [Paenisporosarcina quisquiliarum]